MNQKKKTAMYYTEGNAARKMQAMPDYREERRIREQEEREAQAKARAHVKVNIPDSGEIVRKNLEASKNAGKR